MSICKQCIHFVRLNEDLIDGHHPECPVVDEKKPTFKISYDGNGFVTHNIGELQDILQDSIYDIGDVYTVEIVQPLSLREIHELPEFEGF